MADVSIPEYRVTIDQLRPGVFIRLERANWFDHPFLFNSFKIRDDEQLEILRDLGVREVICIPEKSDRLPLSPAEAEKVEPPAATPSAPAREAMSRLWEIKKARAEKLRQKKQRIADCERRYTDSARTADQLVRAVAGGDNSAVVEALRFIGTLSAHFLADSESTLHLLNVMPPDEQVYSHALNVTVLSLMLGQVAGLDEEGMLILGMSALFHDIGKQRLEKKLLKKRSPLTRSEQNLLQQHCEYGRDLLDRIPEFPQAAADAVYQHHEQMDGNGYPQGLSGENICAEARMVAVANIYDNHCNHPDPAESLTPYLALSYMFTRQKAHFAPEYLTMFIRCLGVYPPGTVVQLNNDAIGMVMAVNPENQLSPSLVVYDPEIPKKEALIIDLAEEQDLKVEKSIRLNHLPPEIFEYLNPRTRITYFIDS